MKLKYPGEPFRRHDECTACRFYQPDRPSGRCLPCGAGENFELLINDEEPDENELWKMCVESSDEE